MLLYRGKGLSPTPSLNDHGINDFVSNQEQIALCSRIEKSQYNWSFEEGDYDENKIIPFIPDAIHTMCLSHKNDKNVFFKNLSLELS